MIMKFIGEQDPRFPWIPGMEYSVQPEIRPDQRPGRSHHMQIVVRFDQVRLCPYDSIELFLDNWQPMYYPKPVEKL